MRLEVRKLARCARDVRLFTFHNFKLNIARTVRSEGCFFFSGSKRAVSYNAQVSKGLTATSLIVMSSCPNVAVSAPPNRGDREI